MVQLGDYPEVFQTAFADRMVRRPESAGAHLRIYGQLEARLTQSDRVILGGLVEGVWPPAPRDRSLAEPADAARARPRSAGAAHRPLRA